MGRGYMVCICLVVGGEHLCQSSRRDRKHHGNLLLLEVESLDQDKDDQHAQDPGDQTLGHIVQIEPGQGGGTDGNHPWVEQLGHHTAGQIECGRCCHKPESSPNDLTLGKETLHI